MVSAAFVWLVEWVTSQFIRRGDWDGHPREHVILSVNLVATAVLWILGGYAFWLRFLI